MKVRQLRIGDDLDPAKQLLLRFFREEGFDTPDKVIAANVGAMAGIESCIILVAEEGELAVGVATLSLEFGIEFGWSAELGDLYVAPDWRGRGVAHQLVKTGEEILRERGVAGYQVTVTALADALHDLKRFYRALGFDGEGRLLLWKKLK